MFLLALSSLSGFAQLNWTTPVNYATPTSSSTDDAIWFGDFNNDRKKKLSKKYKHKQKKKHLMRCLMREGNNISL